jgi:hypothetical protein
VTSSSTRAAAVAGSAPSATAASTARLRTAVGAAPEIATRSSPPTRAAHTRMIV